MKLRAGSGPQTLKVGLYTAMCAAAALHGPAARADTITFDLQDGGRSGSFAIDSGALPGYSNPTWNVIMPIIHTTGAMRGDEMAQFFAGGGFTMISNYAHYETGVQLYSGSELAPDFLPGVYTGLTGGATANATLTITRRAPAPMVGSGLFAAIAALAGISLTRRRSRKVNGAIA